MKINGKLPGALALLLAVSLLLSVWGQPALAASMPETSPNVVHPLEEEHIKVDPATSTGYVDNLMVLITREGVDDQEVLSWFPGEDARVVGRFPGLRQLQVRITPRNKAQLQALAERLMEKEQVRYAHLELAAIYPGLAQQSSQEDDEWKSGVTRERPSQNMPDRQWWYQAIGLTETRQAFKGLNYVKTAVVDDGFDTSHPDLKLDFTSRENQQLNQAEFHGTHVAGVISQMMPEATVMVSDVYPIPELDPEWYMASQSQFTKNLVDLVEAKAKVINYSMGMDLDEDFLLPWNWEYSATLSVYIWLLKQAGYDFLITQSAGNVGIDSSRNGYFASIAPDNCLVDAKVQASLGVKDKLEAARQTVMDSLVIVTAVDKPDSKGQYIVPDDANRGPWVSLAAPGEHIISTVPGGYNSSGGTSQAAPIAAGALALIWSLNKDLTSGQVKKLLVDSATVFATDPRAKGTEQRSSYPMINLVEAVKRAKP